MGNATCKFQSSPGPKTGCNDLSYRGSCRSCTVSILTRPEDRVQRSGDRTGLASPVFQSSPGPKTGCNRRWRGLWVSWLRVSILTRPEDRVQRRDHCCQKRGHPRFNPHPARRPGATGKRFACKRRLTCFNPHPARRPGATRLLFAQLTVCYVSILTRPEDRVQQCAPGTRGGDGMFQSSPGPKTGCNGGVLPGRNSYRLFQSSPGPKTGCNGIDGYGVVAGHCFNPHPARRPGATCVAHSPRAVQSGVSILTRPEDRVQR